MAKMFEMMKQVRMVKQMQKQLAAKTVSATSRDNIVVVQARGDMTIKSITLDPAALATIRPDQLERHLVSTVNSALDSAKKAAAADMSKLTGGLGGLSEMLGG